jgi:hypothetical protein
VPDRAPRRQWSSSAATAHPSDEAAGPYSNPEARVTQGSDNGSPHLVFDQGRL